MIARLRGILESIDEQTVLIRPLPGDGPALAGLEMWLEVGVPAYLARSLAVSVGQPVTLWTMTYLEGQNQGSSFIPRLIGFSSARERDFFELFTTVKGIGNRRALRALAEEPGAIATAVVRGDAKALTQLPEVGKRLAETIIAELKGKIDIYADLTTTIAGVAGKPLPTLTTPARIGPEQDAVAALMNLGQKRDEAERNISRIVASDQARTWTVDDLVRAAFAGR